MPEASVSGTHSDVSKGIDVDCLGPKGVDRLYHDIMEKPRNHKIPALADIYCWALDGRTFDLKAPCVRCLHLYPTWILNMAPTETDQIEKALAGFNGELMGPHRNGCWVYCAETVEAAKLYAFHYGKLVLEG